MSLHRLVEPALAGFPVAYFSPSFPMLSEVWREYRRALEPITRDKSEQEKRLELITGGVVKFWSLDDPDTARGQKYARVAIDEAAKVRNLEDAWNGAIRPTLADYRGSADFYSTPRGRDFFWKCHTRGIDRAEPEWKSWCFPTAANPFIDPGEIEAARRQLPDRVFRQEFLAEFLEDAGGVFRMVAEAIDRGRTRPDEPDPARRYAMGVDLARVEDFTVISVVDDLGRQAYHERFNRISWDRQVDAIGRVAARYRAQVVLDSTGVGDPILEAVRRAGVRVEPYQFTAASKERLIDGLALRLERGELRLMDVPEQEHELLAYEYEITPGRNVRMNAPAGLHDDCVIGLALAVHGIAARRTIKFYAG